MKHPQGPPHQNRKDNFCSDVFSLPTGLISNLYFLFCNFSQGSAPTFTKYPFILESRRFFFDSGVREIR